MDKILSLDRQITLFLNGSDSSFMDYVMLQATATVTWIPVGLLCLWIIYKHTSFRNLLVVLLFLALCLIISDQTSCALFKPLFRRFRPTHDPLLVDLIDVANNYRGGRYGFFSAHASNTLTIAIFFCKIFRHKIVTLLFMSWVLLNCYTRVYLGVHFFGDIVVGLCFGLLWGHLMYWLYGKYFEPRPFIASQGACTIKGYLIRDMKLLSWAIVATYAAILIIAFVWSGQT